MSDVKKNEAKALKAARQAEAKKALEAYWAGSIGTSVLNAVKAGNVVVIDAR